MLALEILLREIFHLLRSKSGRAFLWLAFLYGRVPRFVFRKIRFFNYKLQVPDCLSFIWQFKDIFADESYCFQPETKTPVIYDCGANIGLSVLYFKKCFPQAKITAFEADPHIAGILEDNLKDNSVEDVKVINKAVWNEDGTVSFASEGADGGSISIGNNSIFLPAIRLKTFLEEEPHIDLLKMDIEGAEGAVLKDCAENLQNVKNIFIEYHSYIGQKQELDMILTILTQNGFRYFLRPEQDRRSPLLNRFYRNNTKMDLQINVFGYKN